MSQWDILCFHLCAKQKIQAYFLEYKSVFCLVCVCVCVCVCVSSIIVVNAVWRHAVICWEAALGTTWPIHFILSAPFLSLPLLWASPPLLPSPISLFIFHLSFPVFCHLFYFLLSGLVKLFCMVRLYWSWPSVVDPWEINRFVSLSINILTRSLPLNFENVTVFPWHWNV